MTELDAEAASCAVRLNPTGVAGQELCTLRQVHDIVVPGELRRVTGRIPADHHQLDTVVTRALTQEARRVVLVGQDERPGQRGPESSGRARLPGARVYLLFDNISFLGSGYG